MSDREPSPAPPAEPRRAFVGQAARWLAGALVLAALAGCEHGAFSFEGGRFKMPVGPGSSRRGSNR
jgi:hypothetical protein